MTINITDVNEPPAVSGVSKVSVDGAYAIGATITVNAAFSAAVTVIGTPQLALDIGGQTRQADYASGSGADVLLFSYAVAEGDEDTDGIGTIVDGLALNGGEISAGAAAANLSVAAHSFPGILVDGVRPALESATVEPDGATITLVFDEPYDIAAAAVVTAAPFSVTAGGSAVTVGALGVVMEPGSVYRRFELRNLSPAITYGQTVIVSYTDPTAGDNTTMVLQDAAGNDVASFTTRLGRRPRRRQQRVATGGRRGRLHLRPGGRRHLRDRRRPQGDGDLRRRR